MEKASSGQFGGTSDGETFPGDGAQCARRTPKCTHPAASIRRTAIGRPWLSQNSHLDDSRPGSLVVLIVESRMEKGVFQIGVEHCSFYGNPGRVMGRLVSTG